MISVSLSAAIRKVVLVNILEIEIILFKFIVACFVLKTVFIELMIRLQRHAKELRYIYTWNFLNKFQHHYVILNITKLTFIQVYKSIIYLKNSANSIHFYQTRFVF